MSLWCNLAYVRNNDQRLINTFYNPTLRDKLKSLATGRCDPHLTRANNIIRPFFKTWITYQYYTLNDHMRQRIQVMVAARDNHTRCWTTVSELLLIIRSVIYCFHVFIVPLSNSLVENFSPCTALLSTFSIYWIFLQYSTQNITKPWGPVFEMSPLDETNFTSYISPISVTNLGLQPGGHYPLGSQNTKLSWFSVNN